MSTVDSGNLAGHLIALRQACLGLVDEPVFDGRVWRALETALALAEERLKAARRAIPRRSISTVPATRWQARRRADLDAPLARVAEPLKRARSRDRRRADSPPEAAEPARSGSRWSLRLIAAHSAGWAAASRPQLLRHLAELAARRPPRRSCDAGSRRSPSGPTTTPWRWTSGSCSTTQRKLFAIGFQQTPHSLDGSYYDLLASEARLASFVAVAKNDVPADHWFRLGRTLTYAAGAPALVSWSGSMFEYLMPLLVMRSFPFTVLTQTYDGRARPADRLRRRARSALGCERERLQRARPASDLPVSSVRRARPGAQARARPGAGVAPYASALAAMVDPERALANLRLLEASGALGRYGFRDALDYTRARSRQPTITWSAPTWPTISAWAWSR